MSRFEKNPFHPAGDELFGTTPSIAPLPGASFGSPVQPVATQESQLPLIEKLEPEHRSKAMALAKQIDPTNRQALLQYGVSAQSELSRFADNILDHVRTKDTGPVGEVIGDLMLKIKAVNPDELSPSKKNFLSRIFGSVAQSTNKLLSRYQKLGSEIDQIADKLDKSRQQLLRDVTLLEALFAKNRDYFQELTIYIAAAKHKLDELRNHTIPALQKKVNASGDPSAVQELNDIIGFADRLEKKAHDLLLSRTITMQTAPQIRLIQNNHQMLVEKIQSSILTTIPLWKNQIVLSLTLFRQQKAVVMQKQVTQTTNDLLLRNSEMLKMNSIEVAKENERGIVSVETLKRTQENLLTTLEETLKIQQEGRMKRQQAERDLSQMEEELKTKLLSMR
jgi:uncharacterized protein YaaN involved in tellurite resistance